MDRKEFKELARKTTDAALALMDGKQTEYAGNRGDAFYNFIRSAEIEQTTPELSLFSKMNKHFVSIIDMIEVPAIYSEAYIDSKVHDMSNYLLLLKGLLLDRNKVLESRQKIIDAMQDVTDDIERLANQKPGSKGKSVDLKSLKVQRNPNILDEVDKWPEGKKKRPTMAMARRTR